MRKLRICGPPFYVSVFKRSKSLNFRGPRFGALFFIFAYPENFMCLARVVKKFEFFAPPFGGPTILVPPNLSNFIIFLY